MTCWAGVAVVADCIARLSRPPSRTLIVTRVMFFPFTFTVSVPGIINPFSKPPYPLSGARDSPALAIVNHPQEKQRLPDRRPHPSSLPPPEPLARKRGWQPSSPEPSPATTTITASTRGYLNVRPRYRDFTVTPEAREEDEGTEMAAGKCINDQITARGWIISFHHFTS
jgi:hypothetical protein